MSLSVTDTDIGELIMTITVELPRNEDVARVRALLAWGGWPLAVPHPRRCFPPACSPPVRQSSERPKSSSIRASLATRGASAPYSVGR